MSRDDSGGKYRWNSPEFIAMYVAAGLIVLGMSCCGGFAILNFGSLTGSSPSAGLRVVLDSWVLGDYDTQLQKKRADLFAKVEDQDMSLGMHLLRYQLGPAQQNADGSHRIQATLIFQSNRGGAISDSRIFTVRRGPDGRLIVIGTPHGGPVVTGAVQRL